MTREILAIEPDRAGLQVPLERLEPCAGVRAERFLGRRWSEAQIARGKLFADPLRNADRRLAIADLLGASTTCMVDEHPPRTTSSRPLWPKRPPHC